MPDSRTIRRSLPLALVSAVVTLGAASAPAFGAGYGELAHFGAAGTGNGQFEENKATTSAFGVDPTDNSIYVGDRPKEKPKESEFRIQKLSSTGTFEASVSFKVKKQPSIEGIAVDSKRGVVYVLAVQERPDEEEQEKKGGTSVDPEITAATELYAFSTTPSGTKLVPATGANAEGVLTPSSTFEPESKVPGKALLEPSGITVDPVSGEVIILGREDPGEVEEETQLRVALQRITTTGALGTRWVDTKEFFGEVNAAEATSPAVTPTGKVLVLGGGALTDSATEQIDEIPASFNSAEAPKPLAQFASGANELVGFPGLPLPNNGGGLSVGPDGTIYAYAGIRQEEAGPKFSTPYPGVLSFSPTGTELGWTGGRPWTENSPPECSISFNGHPQVSAGEVGDVFVFDTNPKAPNVIEFGKEGKGCLEASASAPVATVKGQPVTGAVKAGTQVTLSSTLTQANATSVKWSFEGEGETTTTNQYQSPEVTHTFATTGEHTVTETITTDDLASPTLTETPQKTKLTVKVKVEAGPPTAQFNAPSEVGVGETANFQSTSTDPNGSKLEKYVWNFGDGTPETTTTTGSTSHSYSAAGAHQVTLKVTDALGLTSAPFSRVVNVAAPSAPGPEPVPSSPPPSGGSTSTTTTTTGSSGSGGVQSYQASLASSSLSVTPSGSLVIKVDCLGQSSCNGTVTLRTLTAVSAGAGKHKAVLTLASGSFSAGGGSVKAVTLHLSAKGRQLLSHSHTLRARATILAHDSSGATHSTQTTVTLRAGKAAHHH